MSKCERLEKLMLKIASVGKNFYTSIRSAVSDKNIAQEPFFSADSNKLARELSGKEGDGAKEVLERVDTDITLVEVYFEKWGKYQLDENYSETLGFAKEILDSLEEIKSIWDSATAEEKAACLEQARLGGTILNSSFGATSTIFKVGLIVMLIAAVYYEFLR